MVPSTCLLLLVGIVERVKCGLIPQEPRGVAVCSCWRRWWWDALQQLFVWSNRRDDVCGVWSGDSCWWLVAECVWFVAECVPAANRADLWGSKHVHTWHHLHHQSDEQCLGKYVQADAGVNGGILDAQQRP